MRKRNKEVRSNESQITEYITELQIRENWECHNRLTIGVQWHSYLEKGVWQGNN